MRKFREALHEFFLPDCDDASWRCRDCGKHTCEGSKDRGTLFMGLCIKCATKHWNEQVAEALKPKPLDAPHTVQFFLDYKQRES